MSDSLRELNDKVRRFCEERDWSKYHAPKNLVMALMVEVAELSEHFTWRTLEQSEQLGPHERQDIADEIGDIMLYLVNLCARLDIDPVAAAHTKLDKVARRYPVDEVKGKDALPVLRGTRHKDP